MPPAGGRAQAVCSFNQAAVLMDLISLAVIKAPHDPQGTAGLGCWLSWLV
jgi:hypothetical protein